MLFSAQLLHSLQYAFLSSMFLSLEYMALAKKLAYFLHAPSTYFIRFYNASSSWYFLILSIYCIVFFLFFFVFAFQMLLNVLVLDFFLFFLLLLLLLSLLLSSPLLLSCTRSLNLAVGWKTIATLIHKK